jgi:hypothetical protein
VVGEVAVPLICGPAKEPRDSEISLVPTMPMISMDIDDAPPATSEGADGVEHAGRAAGEGSSLAGKHAGQLLSIKQTDFIGFSFDQWRSVRQH